MSELAEPFPMSLQAVSMHLKILEQAGLVTRVRRAQQRPARLAAGPLGEAVDWLEQDRRFWQSSFDALDARLSDE